MALHACASCSTGAGHDMRSAICAGQIQICRCPALSGSSASHNDLLLGQEAWQLELWARFILQKFCLVPLMLKLLNLSRLHEAHQVQ